MSYTFKYYTDGSREHFSWEANTRHYATKKTVKKDFEFTQSLLDFLDLSMDDCLDLFNRMGNEDKKLYEDKNADTVALRNALDEAAKKHIYFELLRLQWLEKLDRYIAGDYTGDVRDFLYYKDLNHIPMQIITAKNKVKFMINKALDNTADQEKTVQQRVAALYAKNADKAFEFRPVTVGFERMNDSAMAEVLFPDSIFDIIDFTLREIIRREVGFKVCKSCGKYFPDIAHGNTEFCNRPLGGLTSTGGKTADSGKTCRDVGSLTKWKERVAASPAILLYNKHYKTRFSRIRAGKITREAFQEWAAKAREYRDKVMTGDMKLEDFEGWLKSGRWE